MVRVPEGFDRVRTIVKKDDGIGIISFFGKTVFAKVDTGFTRS